MTIKELKEKIEFLPDDLPVCVLSNIETSTRFLTILATEVELSKVWIKNENKTIRVYAYSKDCVVIK